MDTTTYLPGATLVEFGSPAMDNLRYALQLLELHAEDLDPEYDAEGVDTGEWGACNRAIVTLREMTTPAV